MRNALKITHSENILVNSVALERRSLIKQLVDNNLQTNGNHLAHHLNKGELKTTKSLPI